MENISGWRVRPLTCQSARLFIIGGGRQVEPQSQACQPHGIKALMLVQLAPEPLTKGRAEF